MSSPTPSNLLISLIKVHAKIQRQLAGPLSCHGISLTDYLVLRELALAPDKRLRRVDLAQQVGLSPSGVTRLLNPLEKIGVIAKEEAARDARVSLVSLTAAGERVLQDAEASFAQAARALFEPLAEGDLEALFRISNSLR